MVNVGKRFLQKLKSHIETTLIFGMPSKEVENFTEILTKAFCFLFRFV